MATAGLEMLGFERSYYHQIVHRGCVGVHQSLEFDGVNYAVIASGQGENLSLSSNFHEVDERSQEHSKCGCYQAILNNDIVRENAAYFDQYYHQNKPESCEEVCKSIASMDTGGVLNFESQQSVLSGLKQMLEVMEKEQCCDRNVLQTCILLISLLNPAIQGTHQKLLAPFKAVTVNVPEINGQPAKRVSHCVKYFLEIIEECKVTQPEAASSMLNQIKQQLTHDEFQAFVSLEDEISVHLNKKQKSSDLLRFVETLKNTSYSELSDEKCCVILQTSFRELKADDVIELRYYDTNGQKIWKMVSKSAIAALLQKSDYVHHPETREDLTTEHFQEVPESRKIQK